MRCNGIGSKGGSWSAENETTLKTPIREQFEQQGHPYYASAWFCDDVTIDPVQMWGLLGIGLSAALNAPATDAVRRVPDVSERDRSALHARRSLAVPRHGY